MDEPTTDLDPLKWCFQDCVHRQRARDAPCWCPATSGDRVAMSAGGRTRRAGGQPDLTSRRRSRRTPVPITQRPRPMRWIESSGIGCRTDRGRSCAPRPSPRQGPNRCPASAGRSGRWRWPFLIGCGTVRTAARRFTRLTELASMDPPTTAANHDSRTSTLRLRAEAARANPLRLDRTRQPAITPGNSLLSEVDAIGDPGKAP